MLVLFDCRLIVHNRVMPTRHLVKLAMAPHHVNRQGSIRSMYVMMWQMLAVPTVSSPVMSILKCTELTLDTVIGVWKFEHVLVLWAFKFFTLVGGGGIDVRYPSHINNCSLWSGTTLYWRHCITTDNWVTEWVINITDWLTITLWWTDFLAYKCLLYLLRWSNPMEVVVVS
jgi:hypothetical protein